MYIYTIITFVYIHVCVCFALTEEKKYKCYLYTAVGHTSERAKALVQNISDKQLVDVC